MEKDLQTLQLFYASALADSAYHYGRHGVMEEVTEEKRKAQQLAATTQLARLGITSLEEAYRRLMRCSVAPPGNSKSRTPP